MKISNILILLMAVFLGLYVVPRWCTRSVPAPDDPFMAKERSNITKAIEESILNYNPLCIDAGNEFPFDSSKGRQLCAKCEMLERAGLASKSMSEQQEHGETRYIVRYLLTDKGRDTYVTGGEYSRNSGRPQFCFGKGALHKIDRIERTPYPGAVAAYIVRYTVRVDEPHPFLFEPGSGSITLPSAGENDLELPLTRPDSSEAPVLLPAQTVRLVRMMDGSMDFQ